MSKDGGMTESGKTIRLTRIQARTTAEGHAWWEIGTPQVSDRADVNKAHAAVELGRRKQRAGI